MLTKYLQIDFYLLCNIEGPQRDIKGKIIPRSLVKKENLITIVKSPVNYEHRHRHFGRWEPTPPSVARHSRALVDAFTARAQSPTAPHPCLCQWQHTVHDLPRHGGIFVCADLYSNNVVPLTRPNIN